MDFSLTTLFVLPASNTLPTTGTNADLVANQFGIFKPDYSPATAGNVAAQKYIILSQGRQAELPGVGTKDSDFIYLKNVQEWYKVTAHSTASVQITDITDFTAVCGEDVTVSLRLQSFYINTAFFNGLTRSFTITTPCCECGDDPCSDVDAEGLIDQFVTLINADTGLNGVAQFVIAEKVFDGSDPFLRINGRQVAAEPTRCDPSAFPYQYDRIMFWAFAYKGPETSQDYNVWDSCDPFATVETVQESTYLRGTSKEVAKLEKDYWSYNTAPIVKRLFKWDIFNGGFTSQVTDGTYYDFYYLKFLSPMNNSWNPTIQQDEAVIIANPTGQNAGTIAVLTAFLGTPTDESGDDFTTTTSTTTTTTTV
jgi:hypothetical protein